MKHSIILFVSILFCNLAQADQIVMKNGDRVTGSIVKKAGKEIVIKTDQFGVVTTSWDQVASVTATTPVIVVLQNGKTIQGTLATTDGKIDVASQDTKVSVAP